MSDILLSWLASEAGLHVEQVERDFANGYLWGQLFSKYNLQPDFESRFENKRTPDAMVNNFTRLQPTFKRLGVNMNTRVANSLMREEPGVAMRLLYSVKQNLGQLNKDLEKYKSTGRLGRELGAAVHVNKTLLEASQYRTSKQSFEQGSMRFFEETIRQKVPTNSKQMMESMHLRRFSERQFKQEATSAALSETERQATATQQASFHDTMQSKLAKSRTDKSKQLERDAAVHASLMRRKEESEREELRVELALAEASRRRKAAGVQQAAQDVTHGIDTFEINMKRLLKGDSNGDEQLAPATTHSPLEHQAKLRSMATSSSKLLEELSGYMSGVRAERVDDLATKREREARRRRMLVEQQSAARDAECKAEAEALLQALARESGEEQRLAARLWQLGQEKQVMQENRALREQQYAEQRAQDWEQTLLRELELHASLRQQYEAQTEVERAAWQAAVAERGRAKAAKHQALCEGMAWQVVQMAERVIEYRQKTGQLVPRNEWRRWLAMFVANDAQLGDPVVKNMQEGPTRNFALERAAVADWLSCRGEFERDQQAAEPIAANAPLGVLVAEVTQQARAASSQDLPESRQLPLKLSVVGPPFSGKTSIAQALAKQFRLRVLEPESLVQAATDAAQAWTAQQQSSNAEDSDIGAGAQADGSATETGTEEAAIQPSKQVQLGMALLAALQAGQPLPDDCIVSLVVLAMEETVGWVPPPVVQETAKPGAKGKPVAKPGKNAVPEEPPKPVQGFVLDGFPRTMEQAVLLEKALTGLDLDAEQAVIDAASQLAPPPPQMLPQTQRVLTSGLDAVLVLSLQDPELALKRALGRRLDPQTGRVYHLEFDPPPATDVGLAARLVDVSDPSNDAAQVQQRLLAHATLAASLDDWHKRFTRLRRPIDSSASLTDVSATAYDATQGILRAKAAVESCRAASEAATKAQQAAEKAREYAELARSHAEGAALELLVAKKAEVQAQALLDGTAEPFDSKAAKKDGKGKKEAVSPPDPAAVELLRAQSAAKCAEQLKVCRAAASDAASYAERAGEAASTATQAVERAQMSLGDAEISATAEVEAKDAAAAAEVAKAAAADAAQRAEVAKQAAEVAVREATRVAEAVTVEPDAKLDLTPAEDATAVEAPDAHDQASQQVQTRALPLQLAGAFLKEFQQLETRYLDGVAMSMTHMVEHNDMVVAHYDTVRQQFQQLLATPDNRAALVAKFQQEFNAVDEDVRKHKETQAELCLRSEELREAIWALCDKKMEAAQSQREAVAANGFVTEHTLMLSKYYTALAQVELDRLYGVLSFVKSCVAARHGVYHVSDPSLDATSAGSVLASPPDLMSGGMPPELKDKLDEKSKTAMPMPAGLTQLAPLSNSLAAAFKLALAAGSTVVAAALPAAEDSNSKKKPAAKKEAGAGKGGKGAVAQDVAPEDMVPVAVTEAINAEVAALASEELRILQDRLILLAQHATTSINGLSALSTTTLDTLAAWTKARYQAECSAAFALDKVAKAAALAGEQLPAELWLEDNGTMVVVDQGHSVVPAHPGYPRPHPRERPPPTTVHSLAQLTYLVSTLVSAAPGGFWKVSELSDVVLGAAGVSELPEGWSGMTAPALQAALKLLDPTFTGYVDWREMLVCLVAASFPAIPTATCTVMASQYQVLAEADKDKDGLLSEEEWLGAELWFQTQPFTPGSAADLEADQAGQEAQAAAKREAFDRAAALKKLLWSAFHGPAPEGSPAAGSPRLDFRAVLLYLCADRDHFSGIKKAFSVAANLAAPNACVTAEQLHRLAYPLGTESGQHIHRCPMSQEDLSKVVAMIYQSRGGNADAAPSISAEQLMYGAHGERIVNHLLGRYQLHDLYIATKLALY